MLIVCNLCKKDDKEFKIPFDEIGSALMAQHLADVHGERRSLKIISGLERMTRD